jgi:hypothetical protein
VTKDGVRLPGTGPIQSGVDRFNERMSKVAEEGGKQAVKDVAKTQVLTNAAPVGSKVKMIAIGTTMAFTELSEAQAKEQYDLYVKSMEKAKLPATLNRDWYVSNLAGVVSAKYWEIPLVMSKRASAQVAKNMRDESDFAECSNKYAKGIFQASHGREIDLSLNLVSNGEQIDLATLQKVAKVK